MHNFRALLLAVSLFSLFSCGSEEEKQASAPAWPNWHQSRTFKAGGETFAPADFEKMDLTLKFSLASGTATGTASIRFRATANGYPYFLSEPKILSASLDGQPAEVGQRRDPDNLNTLQVVPRALEQGNTYELNLEFVLPVNRVDVRPGGASLLTTMSDINSGNYFEAYSPAGLESDSFALRLKLHIEGQPALPHRLIANGDSAQTSPTSWEVDFPPYYTTSSFYVHLTDSTLHVRHSAYQGMSGLIPLTVYAREPELADEGLARLPAIFAELETTYGPYAHASFIAYIKKGGGGMEHAGATISSLGALAHELTHSWFARGVMPTDGRSGWIDEAVASWRDNGYFRAKQIGSRPATNLGRASAFQRFTPGNSYVDGRHFLSELDLAFAGSGGLRPLLKEFFRQWQKKSVRSEDLKEFLQAQTGSDLQGLFQLYVYGGDPDYKGDAASEANYLEGTLHPPSLTEQEIRELR